MYRVGELHMPTETNLSGSCSLEQESGQLHGLSARVQELEAKVAQLTDLGRRRHFGFHHPLDVHEITFPPHFDPAVIIDGEPLPLPPASARMGYAPDDDQLYLKWG